jgi:hypothetical protein
MYPGILEQINTPSLDEVAIPLAGREVFLFLPLFLSWFLLYLFHIVLPFFIFIIFIKGTASNIALNQEAKCLCASGVEVPVEVSMTKFWIHHDGLPTVVLLIRDIRGRDGEGGKGGGEGEKER